jgi:rhomboid protease GluP
MGCSHGGTGEDAEERRCVLAYGAGEPGAVKLRDMGPYPPPSTPEILPPDVLAPPPQPPPARRVKPVWVAAPATHVLLALNILVFLLMLLGRVNFMSPSADDLLRWGADNAGGVLFYGEWWRIVTAMFVHVGIIHLATNMWCLWNLGLLAEPLLGSWGVFAAYILTGAAGNLLSTFVNQWMYKPPAGFVGYFGPVGAGASGAVFGLAGVLIVLLKSQLLPVPQAELKGLRKSVMMFAGINLAIGLGTMVPGSPVRIDNMAHLGGFACGLLFAVPLVPRIGAPRQQFIRRRRLAIAMVVMLLTLFGFYLAQF